ncbi:hypothetical protein NC99_18600 [Sunxiuqinia dokdonensis]|uniref:DUF4386 domain-containing protein n=1 Tax=Sunxiuqinia dokdonensis TaxID=1409788 RepID=A0A0L8VAY5_9BACT|nr:hypothetical protein NC99_18600 [Sunxiuqinia dokdonensis]
MILTGIFAHFFVRAGIIEPGNAAATAQNILNRDFFFRLGLVSDLMFIVSFIFLGLIFYRMFQTTNKHYARALLAVVLVSGAMMGVNVLNQFAAQFVLGGNEYLAVFSEQQLQALSLFFLDLHTHGVHIGHLFYGLWLFALGYLVMKSDLFPGVWAKIFGGLLIAGAVGYEIDFLSYFLFPAYFGAISEFATIPANLGELSLCIWLIFKGAIRKDKHRVVYTAINSEK